LADPSISTATVDLLQDRCIILDAFKCKKDKELAFRCNIEHNSYNVEYWPL